MKRIKPYSPYWERLANEVARTYTPNMQPCMKCGHPVISGYCCTYCGDPNPSEHTQKPNKQKTK